MYFCSVIIQNFIAPYIHTKLDLYLQYTYIHIYIHMLTIFHIYLPLNNIIIRQRIANELRFRKAVVCHAYKIPHDT